MFATAVAAAAIALMPPQDAFWGDRYAIVADPYGHRWSSATPREELSIAEMKHRSEEWASGPHGNAPE